MNLLSLSKSLLGAFRGPNAPEGKIIKTLSGAKDTLTNPSASDATSLGAYARNQVKQRNASLASVSSLSLLDPIGIYSSDLRNYENMEVVLNLALQIITGYVLRSIPFLASSSSREVVKVLSQLHPSKLGWEKLKHNVELNPEDYRFGLPTTEAIFKRKTDDDKQAGGIFRRRSTPSSSNADRRSNLTGKASGLRESNDYSVGKSIELEIPVEKGNDIKIQMDCILTARYAEYDIIKQIAKGGAPDKSWLEKWIRFRAGSTSMGDLLTQGDEVSEHISSRLNDRSRLHDELRRRKNNATVATTFDGKVRYGIGSSIVIISLSVAEKLVRELRFDLADYRQRQKVMAAFSAVCLIVIDKEDEFLIIYYRDVRLPTEVSVASVVSLGKKKNDASAITDALRSLSTNRAPVI